jgi:hypothetical protein
MFRVRRLRSYQIEVLNRTMSVRSGLQRVRDNLMKSLSDLNKQKSKFKGDDNLAAEVSRLEGALIVARDNLVSPWRIARVTAFSPCHHAGF